MLACLAVVASTASRAEPVADFYKGKTITLVVGSSAGGGFDVVGRLVAKYMSRHMPGAPNVVVRNMAGAGGILATKYLYSVAPQDGTSLGALVNTTPFEPLFGTKEATFDPTRIHWLGSPGAEVGTLAVWAASPTKTLDDARRRETTVGAAGVNSVPSFYARLMNAVAGTKLKIVTGYPGQSEIFIAMERGEVEGHPSVFYGGLKSTRPNWISEKKVNFLLQYGAEREQELGDTPFLSDLDEQAGGSIAGRGGAGTACGRTSLPDPTRNSPGSDRRSAQSLGRHVRRPGIPRRRRSHEARPDHADFRANHAAADRGRLPNSAGGRDAAPRARAAVTVDADA